MVDFKPLILCLVFLASCATFEGPANTPVAHNTDPIGPLTTPEIGGDTAIALAFSGGGLPRQPFPTVCCAVLKMLQRKTAKTTWIRSYLFLASQAGRSPRLTLALEGLRGSPCT